MRWVVGRGGVESGAAELGGAEVSRAWGTAVRPGLGSRTVRAGGQVDAAPPGRAEAPGKPTSGAEAL